MKDQKNTNRGYLRYTWRIAIGFLFLGGCFLFTAQPAHAKQVLLFQDDFTQLAGNIWRVARNEQWPNHNLPCMNNTSPARWLNEHQQLKIEIEGNPCVTDFVPSSLNLRDVPHYTLTLKIIFPESVDMDRSVPFLWQDPNNWYDIKFYGHSMELQKVINGVAYPLAGSLNNFSFQPN